MTDISAHESDSTPHVSSAPAPADESVAPPRAKVDTIPRGNGFYAKRCAPFVGGALLGLVLMANSQQIPIFGVPLGLICMMIAAFGIADMFGTFDDAAESRVSSISLRAFGLPALRCGFAFILFAAAIAGASRGVGPKLMWGAAVTALFLLFVASIFQVGKVLGPFAKDEFGEERPLLKREGFWVVAVGALLYFPMLGSYSLSDPWETHYGEVAREILSRDDWISLWWAQDGWFWSKPILNFWIQALAMASLGTGYKPDEMMAHGGAWPEWVVRTPNVLLTLVAMYLLYKGVAKVFGRRAALIGSLILASMPDWYFLAHQTMTDMPVVAPMTAAMGLFLMGLNTGEEVMTKTYGVRAFGREFRLSAWHLVFGCILVVSLPQILYLLSRNVELILTGNGPRGVRWHWDEFKSGSAGNCGLPGNEACNPQVPASLRGIAASGTGVAWALKRYFGGFEPSLQAAVWAVMLGTVVYLNWGERRVRRLCYLAAWFWTAIATMGKGPVGIALPALCALAYIGTKKRWAELARLEIVSGLLIILAVALPWYVAMYVRHGAPFTDRLIFHDMFNRAFGHVHDTNEGDDTSFRFYIWQLGYALFPWTALAPLGLTWWLRRSDRADAGKGDTSVFLATWFIFAFALFTFMGTKFHHYIFPAVPPVAMLIGVVVNDMLGEKTKGLLRTSGIACLSAVLLAVGGALFFPGPVFGGDAPPPPADHMAMSVPGAVCILLGLGVLAYLFVDARKDASAQGTMDPREGGAGTYREHGKAPALTEPTPREIHERLMLGAACLGGGLLLFLVGRDLVLKPEGADQPGAIRFLHLFTYNYRRPWPDSLDFAAPIAGISIAAGILAFAMSVHAMRRYATAAFVGLGLVSAVWGLDVYMIKTAPHWGQHELYQAYYEKRSSPSEMIVAYQMNWKGENFYTSNHVPAFVSSGATFTSWLKKKRDEGAKVMFFVTEHGRIGSLKGEVGGKNFQELTDKKLNNKFVLLRAEL